MEIDGSALPGRTYIDGQTVTVCPEAGTTPVIFHDCGIVAQRLRGHQASKPSVLSRRMVQTILADRRIEMEHQPALRLTASATEEETDLQAAARLADGLVAIDAALRATGWSGWAGRVRGQG